MEGRSVSSILSRAALIECVECGCCDTEQELSNDGCENNERCAKELLRDS